jgi:alpha-galactosidase
MKPKVLFTAALLCFLCANCFAQPLRVFILAGQSNMQGHASISTFDSLANDPKTAPLLQEMRGPDGKPRVCEKVWISSVGCLGDAYSDLTEAKGQLTAGFGAPEDKIGPEFTFGLTMEKKLNEPVLIIKTSWGGRSLHTDFRPPSAGPFVLAKGTQELWDSHPQGAHGIPKAEDRPKFYTDKAAETGVFYREMITHTKKVLKDIKRVVPDYDEKQGYELAGFVWFQGFNDYVDGGVYPKQNQVGGYDTYSDLLTQFIRDVRKDLSSPNLPFVIGVMGIDGLRGDKNAPMMHFRNAQRKPATLDEFKGNVIAVETAPFWDDELEKLSERMESHWPMVDAAVEKEKKTNPQADAWENKMKLMSENFTPAEWKRLSGASNGGYHYLGAAKIIAPIGKAFAEALVGTKLARNAIDDAQQNWPQWRGPNWNGVSLSANPPIQWSESENLKWKVPIPGRGHGTPIVWGDSIFLQTAIPLEKNLPVPDVIPAGTPNIEVRPEESVVSWKAQQFVLLCLNRSTGEIRWQRTVLEAMPHQGHHFKGNFASQSSVTDGKHVYAYFGSYGLYCFDFDGKLIWQRDPEPLAMEAGLGEGTSPALYGNTLVVVADQESRSFVVAIDKHTGKEIWRQNRDEPSNWGTPRIFSHAGREQVVVNGIKVRSYDLATGELLWSFGGHTAGAIPMPAVGHGLVLTASGWSKDLLRAVRLGEGGDLSQEVVWNKTRGVPYVPTPMLWGDELFVLDDGNLFSALNAIDGTEHFKKRLPGNVNFSTSPSGAADRIYLVAEQGTTVVVERGVQFKVLAVNQVPDAFYASPAFVGDAMFLRGESHLYCFQQPDH